MAHQTFKDMIITVGATAITGSTNAASVQAVQNLLEDSGMGDDDRTHLAGLHGKTFTLNGWLDSTVESLIGPRVADRTSVPKSIALDVGPKTFTGSCFFGNVQISGAVDALQTWSADLTVSGDLARA